MPGGMSMPDETVGTQGWDPDQYSKFAAERAKPFVDLLAMVEPVPGGDVIDLGCGTGELTARLHAHTKAATTIGLDTSEAMLAKARPLAGNGLRFELGDIGRFGTERSFDVVFANASLHWVPDHPRLVGQLAAGLRPGGQLAAQVPANTDHPSHAVAFEVATEAPFLEHMGADPLAGAHAVCAPEQYAELLDGIGFSDQHVRLQVYGHHLASTADGRRVDVSISAALGGREFKFSLAEALRTGPVVLYFYPKSFTSVCTLEAHEFAESIGGFHRRRGQRDRRFRRRFWSTRRAGFRGPAARPGLHHPLP